MTEALFYHLQDTTLEAVLPGLLERSLQRGWRVAVQAGSDERVEALDNHLWTYRDDSFLPHVTARGRDLARQPIVLTADQANPNAAQIRFLIDGASLPEDGERYDRIVVIFDGDSDEALAQARAAWSEARRRGFDATYWQPDESGRWRKRE